MPEEESEIEREIVIFHYGLRTNNPSMDFNNNPVKPKGKYHSHVTDDRAETQEGAESWPASPCWSAPQHKR